MKASSLAALSLAAVLAGQIQAIPAAADRSEALARSSDAPFVSASAWQVKGYGPFKEMQQFAGDLPPCEAQTGFSTGVPGTFYDVATRAYRARSTDRSRFLSTLDEAINRLRRSFARG